MGRNVHTTKSTTDTLTTTQITTIFPFRIKKQTDKQGPYKSQSLENS